MSADMLVDLLAFVVAVLAGWFNGYHHGYRRTRRDIGGVLRSSATFRRSFVDPSERARGAADALDLADMLGIGGAA